MYDNFRTISVVPSNVGFTNQQKSRFQATKIRKIWSQEAWFTWKICSHEAWYIWNEDFTTGQNRIFRLPKCGKLTHTKLCTCEKFAHTKLGAFETLISRLGKNTFSGIKNEENFHTLFEVPWKVGITNKEVAKMLKICSHEAWYMRKICYHETWYILNVDFMTEKNRIFSPQKWRKFYIPPWNVGFTNLQKSHCSHETW